jgi:hypothetical protein
MRVEIAVLWRGGKQIPRWQLEALQPVTGQLVIEEVRDELLHRSMRVAKVIDFASPDAAPLTLFDVTVLYAKDYTLSLSGFERNTSAGDMVAFAQTWIVKILPPS